MYDPDLLATFEAGQYSVDPAVMYPATIDRILDLDPYSIPAEFGSPEMGRQMMDKALAIPDRAWELAFVPRDQVAEEDTPMRAEALGEAFSWFKAALVAAHPGEPIVIHVSKNLDWRD